MDGDFCDVPRQGGLPEPRAIVCERDDESVQVTFRLLPRQQQGGAILVVSGEVENSRRH